MTAQLTAQSCVYESVMFAAVLHSMLASLDASTSVQCHAQVLLVQPSLLLGFSTN